MEPTDNLEQKPAEQASQPKAKSNKLPWVICAVLALAIVGLGIFLVMGAVKKSEDKPQCETIADDYKKDKGGNQDGGESGSGAEEGEIRKVGFVYEGEGPITFYSPDDGNFYMSFDDDYFSSNKDMTVKYDYSKIGTAGKFKVSTQSLGGYNPFLGQEVKEITVDGYKLNLKNIAFIFYNITNNRQAFNFVDYTFIDVDGNLSILSVYPYKDTNPELERVVLYKNILTNVAAVSRVSTGISMKPVAIYRDGVVAEFDLDKYGVRW